MFTSWLLSDWLRLELWVTEYADEAFWLLEAVEHSSLVKSCLQSHTVTQDSKTFRPQNSQFEISFLPDWKEVHVGYQLNEKNTLKYYFHDFEPLKPIYILNFYQTCLFFLEETCFFFTGLGKSERALAIVLS